MQEATQQLTMQHLPISCIIPDPNQPRHYFDEKDMIELTDSIRLNGILQPILVRYTDTEGQYMVVCGERRYRASLAISKENAERNTIPCTVRQLTDEQTLEIQIIENLQRKDIAPLEEAVAFLSLKEQNNFSIEDIAVKVAKSPKYVALRIKLNDLLPDFKDMLSENVLKLADAYNLCKQSEQVQVSVLNYLLNTSNTKDWREKSGFKITSFDHIIKNAEVHLSSAVFDTEKEYEGSIACTACPFNTTNSMSLFEENIEPICTKRSCYESKTQAHINQKIVEWKQTPTLLVSEYYNQPSKDSEKLLIKKLEEAQLNFLTANDYNEITINEDHPGTYEQWLENFFKEDETEEELAALYKSDLGDYAKAEEEYKFEIAKPTTLKAVVAVPWNMSDFGKEIYIEKLDSSATSHSTKPLSIEEQIEEWEEDENYKEIKDLNIIFSQSVDALKSFLKGYTITGIEGIMPQLSFLYMREGFVSQNSYEWLTEKMGIHEHMDDIEILKLFSEERNKALLPHFLMLIIIDRCHFGLSPNGHLSSVKRNALFEITKHYLYDTVANIEEEQYSVSQQRKEELAKKITALKAN